MKKESYKPCSCHEEGCFLIDTNSEEPCWEQVELLDEDLLYDEEGEICDRAWIFLCKGHADRFANLAIINMRL